MRHVTQSANRRFSLWWLLPLVLLALPNCGLPSGDGIFDEDGDGGCDSGDVECDETPDDVFFPGEDQNDAIFCEIRKPPSDDEDPCATAQEAADAANISLSEAATALVNGDVASFALDFSDTTACGGLPKKIWFFGEYPEGLKVCINCGTQIPNPHADMLKACKAKCQDLINQDGNIPAEGAADFCDANVTLATNHDPDICYGGACSDGNSTMNWDDPRKSPEPVVWVDHHGTTDAGGTNQLRRTDPTSGSTTDDFNAGAASAQIITTGDAWVEFEALGTNLRAHVIGVRESVDSVGDPCFDASLCPDNDPSVYNIGFALALNTDSQVYVFEGVNGVLTGQGPFGTYTAGERYRVNVRDNHDGTATITYLRQVAGVFTHLAESTPHPQYPLRVDTSFREVDATLQNVNIVRIK